MGKTRTSADTGFFFKSKKTGQVVYVFKKKQETAEQAVDRVLSAHGTSRDELKERKG